MPTHYDFVPKPEIADWIDDNISSWTVFCYDNIYRKQRKQYQNKIESLGYRLLIILLGMILMSFSFITTNMINYLMIIIGGTCIIILGFLMLYMELRNGR